MALEDYIFGGRPQWGLLEQLLNPSFWDWPSWRDQHFTAYITGNRDQGLDLLVDLPGVDPETIKVSEQDGTLVVEVNGDCYGAFNIPDWVDVGQIVAEAKHGRLAIHLPTRPQAERRVIQVRTPPAIVEAVKSPTLTEGQEVQNSSE